MSFLLKAAAVFVAVVGLLAFIHDSVVIGEPTTLAAASVEASSTLTVRITGTITYYPNNVGAEIPYLVYQSSGGVATKALVFNSTSECETSGGEYPCTFIADALGSYYAGSVHATGTIDAEHLLVSTLSAS